MTFFASKIQELRKELPSRLADFRFHANESRLFATLFDVEIHTISEFLLLLKLMK